MDSGLDPAFARIECAHLAQERTREGVAVSDLLSETAFSLGYTADDSLIVRIVLERHQELFHGHCH